VGHDTSIPVLEQRQAVPVPNPLAESPSGARDGARSGSAGSLYVHVPFCFHKCHYCDFYSIVDSRDRQEAFLERLLAELRALAPRAGRLRTVFVGGGTPTLLRVDLWERLLAGLAREFEWGAGGGDESKAGGPVELTVECNPETASAELFDVLVAGGVNRLSVGAQSFEPRHLKTLERRHDPDNVERAMELARAAGIERLSLDLIFAIPRQTLAEWERDLERALALGTEHLSCYALTYEPNTAMTTRLGRGEFEPCDPDLEADMYLATVERCRGAGLERYEVSNFARAGAACAHNLAYWRQQNWLAAGPSASGHMDGLRWKNVPRLDTWLGSGEGLSPAIDVEHPDPRRNLIERVMTGIRSAEGLGATETLDRARAMDPEIGKLMRRTVDDAVSRGNLIFEGDRWRLTEQGFLFADGVARDLIWAILSSGEP